MGVKASAPKKKKPDEIEDDQNNIEVAGLSTPPQIFHLSADCCDEIFEYLSIVDMHSFSQTCKILKKVVGAYIKRHYSAKDFYADKKGALTCLTSSTINLPGFHQYVTKMHCYTRQMEDELAKHTNEFSSIKSLTCSENIFKEKKFIEKISPKIDYLEIIYCGECCEIGNFSKLIPNLKYLNVVKYEYNEYKWLNQDFPNLTALKCGHSPIFEDLANFFERNPNVKTFAVKMIHIWEIKDKLLSSTIKLDWLKVEISNENPPGAIELLNQLYKHGFYKRVHLILNVIDQQLSKKLVTLKGLEMLTADDIEPIYCLPQIVQLKRLDIVKSHPTIELGQIQNKFELLASGLVNLQRIYLAIRSFDEILPFIRRSLFLKKMQLSIISDENKALNLTKINKERAKLPEARKVTIYVEDDVYLATKWATENGDTNLSLVEMRRSESFEWDVLYCFY